MVSILGSDRWVAIVDDDESIRRALARLLRVHDIEACAFHSAQDYLTHAPGAPACICLDLFLRGSMNGFELSKHLRASGDSTPIVFMTGQDESERRALVNDGHPGVILRKPVNPELLLQILRELMCNDGVSGVA
jgi:FixJ family two-component response regulator